MLHRSRKKWAVGVLLIARLAIAGDEDLTPSPLGPLCTARIFDSLEQAAGESAVAPKALWTDFQKRFPDRETTKLWTRPHILKMKVKDIIAPEEGFLAKVMMIRNARHTLDVGTYIFHSDPIGYALLKEVKDALARGVDVRINVDSLGSMHPFHGELKSLYHAERGFVVDAEGKPTTRKAQIDVVVFNANSEIKSNVINLARKVANLFLPEEKALSMIDLWRDRRMHSKMLLADIDVPERAMAMLGGRNLAKEYYGIPQRNERTFNDAEILIRNDPSEKRGSLATTLGLDYNRLYYHEGNKALSGLFLSKFNPRLRVHHENMEKHSSALLEDAEHIATKLKTMQDDGFLENGFINAKTMIVTEVENITRRHAVLHPEAADQAVHRNLASIIQRFRAQAKKAKKTIDIVSPYLYLTPEEISFFKQWLSEDPSRKLRILTNSVMSGDNMPAQAVFDSKIAPVLKESPDFKDLQKQVEIYEFGKLDGTVFGGKEIYGKIHAKFAIIDGETTLVTSSNADARSRNLNSEVGAIILKSPDFAKKYLDYMNEMVDRSYAWGSQEYHELRDHPKIKMKMLLENTLIRTLAYLNLTVLL